MIGRALGITAAALLAAEALWALGLVERADEAVYDAWHGLRGRRGGAPVPVVVASIDDRTLDTLRDPMLFWGPHFAAAIETARDHGATTIGLDVLTRVSGEDFFRDHGLLELGASRTWDAGLRQNLFRGDVVLVGQRMSGDEADRLELPLGEYLLMLGDARSRLGLDNLPHDPDGVVRRWRPVVAHELAAVEGAPVHAFSTALALHHLGLDAAAERWSLAGRALALTDERVRVVFRGPPGSFPQVPFWKLAQPDALTEAERARLRGAIVLVGATHSGSTDRLRTPYTDALMPGVEVHANAVATLLSGDRLIELGRGARVALGALCGGALSLLLLRVRARSGSVAVACAALALPLCGYASFTADRLLPVVYLAAVLPGVVAGALLSRYLGEARERRRIRGLFGRYVSDAVVDDILASPEGVRLGGERREVTVLFSDIRGFTTLSEALAPEEVVEMLNAWFALACRPILDEGGVVDKFIGDAVMAVFGAPHHGDDHPDRALRAALGVADAADGFAGWMRERFAGRELPPFAVGVGLHTGPAVVGNIGLEERAEYTVIGDAVNVAARLEGLTKQLGCTVLASGATLDRARAAYRLGDATEVAVKGRRDVVRVIQVLGGPSDP